MKFVSKAAVSVVSLIAAASAQATEGGGSIYPVGTENYMCCALPPPGLYGMVFSQAYRADKVRGNDGQVVTPASFRVNAFAVAPRLVYVTKETVAGASLAFHTILPLVNLDVKVAPGIEQDKTGLGDIVLGAALGWHHSPATHSVLALDVYAPTGKYDQGDLANIGRNYWAIQPVVGITHVTPDGLNADFKAMWTYNFKNKDTNYKSGQEFIVDYSLGWGLGNGWTVGVGGYVYQQINDDKQGGQKLAGSKGRAFAIGPSVKYDSGKGWFVTGKFQDESNVRNRADGRAFWLKAVFPL